MIVHSYPFFPALESVFDAFAAAQAELSIQGILATASVRPMAEEMKCLDDYIVFITECYRHEYNPIPRPRVSGAMLQAHPPAPSSKPYVSLRDMMLF